MATKVVPEELEKLDAVTRLSDREYFIEFRRLEIFNACRILHNLKVDCKY